MCFGPWCPLLPVLQSRQCKVRPVIRPCASPSAAMLGPPGHPRTSVLSKLAGAWSEVLQGLGTRQHCNRGKDAQQCSKSNGVNGRAHACVGRQPWPHARTRLAPRSTGVLRTFDKTSEPCDYPYKQTTIGDTSSANATPEAAQPATQQKTPTAPQLGRGHPRARNAVHERAPHTIATPGAAAGEPLPCNSELRLPRRFMRSPLCAEPHGAQALVSVRFPLCRR